MICQPIAAASIALPVPRELAINTNHPNVESISIEINPGEAPVRRSKRQIRSPNRSSLQSNSIQDFITGRHTSSSIHQDSRSDQVDVHTSNCAVATADPFLGNHDADTGATQSTKQLKSPARGAKRAGTKKAIPLQNSTLLSEQRSTASLCHKPVKVKCTNSKSKSVSPCAKIASRALAARSLTSSPRCFGQTAIIDDKSTEVEPSYDTFKYTRRGRTSASPSRRNKRSQITKPGNTLPESAPRKTAKRRALEAHLLEFNDYGNIRHHSTDPIAPANAHFYRADMEAMFNNESLMRRIEGYRDERLRKNESEKKLWELGKTMPWVRSMFTTFEEYEAWRDQMDRRTRPRTVAESEEGGDVESYSGDTTDEDDNGGILRLLEASQLLNDSRSGSRAEHTTKSDNLTYGSDNTQKLSALADVCIGCGLR